MGVASQASSRYTSGTGAAASRRQCPGSRPVHPTCRTFIFSIETPYIGTGLLHLKKKQKTKKHNTTCIVLAYDTQNAGPGCSPKMWTLPFGWPRESRTIHFDMFRTFQGPVHGHKAFLGSKIAGQKGLEPRGVIFEMADPFWFVHGTQQKHAILGDPYC